MGGFWSPDDCGDGGPKETGCIVKLILTAAKERVGQLGDLDAPSSGLGTHTGGVHPKSLPVAQQNLRKKENVTNGLTKSKIQGMQRRKKKKITAAPMTGNHHNTGEGNVQKVGEKTQKDQNLLFGWKGMQERAGWGEKTFTVQGGARAIQVDHKYAKGLNQNGTANRKCENVFVVVDLRGLPAATQSVRLRLSGGVY